MFGTIAISIRNLLRHKRRTLLVLSAVGLGQAVVIFVNAMMAGFYGDMQEAITGPLVGHVQVHHPEWRDERATDLCIGASERLADDIRGLPLCRQVSSRLYSAALAAAGEEGTGPIDAEPAMMLGLDPQQEAADGGLLEGLEPSQYPEGRHVLVGPILATRLGLSQGSELALIGQDADGFPAADLYTVRAIRQTKLELVNRMGVVLNCNEARRFLALPDQAHELIAWADSPDDAPRLAEQIRELELGRGLEVLPWREAVPQLVSLIDMKAVFDLIFVGIILLAATAGIANTSVMSTFERRREFGTLLAIGARPNRIISMVIIEAVILGLAGVIAGSIVGAIAVGITSRTGINYAALAGRDDVEMAFRGISFSFVTYPRFELRQVLYGVVAILATSVMASLWPAIGAARMQPTEALRR